MQQCTGRVTTENQPLRASPLPHTSRSSSSSIPFCLHLLEICCRIFCFVLFKVPLCLDLKIRPIASRSRNFRLGKFLVITIFFTKTLVLLLWFFSNAIQSAEVTNKFFGKHLYVGNYWQPYCSVLPLFPSGVREHV